MEDIGDGAVNIDIQDADFKNKPIELNKELNKELDGELGVTVNIDLFQSDTFATIGLEIPTKLLYDANGLKIRLNKNYLKSINNSDINIEEWDEDYWNEDYDSVSDAVLETYEAVLDDIYKTIVNNVNNFIILKG